MSSININKFNDIIITMDEYNSEMLQIYHNTNLSVILCLRNMSRYMMGGFTFVDFNEESGLYVYLNQEAFNHFPPITDQTIYSSHLFIIATVEDEQFWVFIENQMNLINNVQ